VFEQAPKVVASAEDHPALGGACYLMERVRGVIIRRRLPRGVSATEDTMRRLSESMIDTLARLHEVDVSQAPLATLGRPEGYAQRQVIGWTERYARSKTDDLKGMERMADFLAERLPSGSALPPSLVHNDFKYDNLVLNPDDIGDVRAVLDWEMATIGDPLMDLGTTLGYWVEAGDPAPIQALAFGPTAQPGSLTRAELVARYTATRGASIPDPVFYYVFGIFKIAVIIQQIYARFVRGTTKDARFASLGAVVAVLASYGDSVCDRDSLSPSSG
jgi:aminoglycoside phosphotransferase (APT) family kinase protein